jgi:hypothetical protein
VHHRFFHCERCSILFILPVCVSVMYGRFDVWSKECGVVWVIADCQLLIADCRTECRMRTSRFFPVVSPGLPTHKKNGQK